MKILKIAAGTLLFCLVAQNLAAQSDVLNQKVKSVYQMDHFDGEFLFETGNSNGCDGKWFKVKSPSESIANRKFSIVLAAYTSDRTIAFYDFGV